MYMDFDIIGYMYVALLFLVQFPHCHPLLLIFLQIRGIERPICVSNVLTIVLEPSQHAPTPWASTSTLKWSADLPFARIVVPYKFFTFRNIPEREEVERPQIIVPNANVGIAGVIDQDRRQVHYHVPIPTGLGAVGTLPGVYRQGACRHYQIIGSKLPGSKQASPLFFRLANLQDAAISAIAIVNLC